MEPSSSTSLSDQEGKLFVGGLSRNTVEGALARHFERFGEVVEVAVVRDRFTGDCKGFAFVKFADPSSADRALEAGRHVIQGKIAEVKRALPKGERKCLNQERFHNNGFIENYTNGYNGKKIFLGGLSSNVSKEELHTFFEQFGRIVDVVVMYDSNTNHSRGFGFITFEAEEAVNKVMQETYYILNNKRVEVKIAVPKDGSDFIASNCNGRSYRSVGGGRRSSTPTSSYGEMFYPNRFQQYFGPLGYASPHVYHYGTGGFYSGYRFYNGYGNYAAQLASAESTWNNQGMVSVTRTPQPYGYPFMYSGYMNNYGYPSGIYGGVSNRNTCLPTRPYENVDDMQTQHSPAAEDTNGETAPVEGAKEKAETNPNEVSAVQGFEPDNRWKVSPDILSL